MKKNALSSIFGPKVRKRTISYVLVLALFVIVQILRSSGSLTRQITSLLVPVCAYTVAAIGLNMNVGISGELNLGQAGFMSVGGFSAVVCSSVLSGSVTSGPVRLLISIAVGALIAGVIGWLISIPVLKLEGDYLAIVTLAFGQIIMALINNMYIGYDSTGLHFSFVNNTLKLGEGGVMIVSGPMGTAGIQTLSSFAAGVILIVIALIIVYNLIYSKSGRAIQACRDNRIAAETIGINVAKTKTLAFVVSAGLAGAAGALYMLNYSSVAATKFDFNTSILILVYVVLGGLGNMTGTIISTIVLVMLPEMLRFLSSYRMLIYALVLIAIMLISNNEKLKTWAEEFREKHFSKKGVKTNE